MKILVTGKSGFLSKSIEKSYFNKIHNIDYIGREDLSLLNISMVQMILEQGNYDVIIHTAISGGKRGDLNNIQIFETNLQMYFNLAKSKAPECLLINFCSGAALDRTSGVANALEHDVFVSYPQDYYGLSKNIIANHINNQDRTFLNLRLFGCFGELENENRFIKKSINSLKNGNNIVITKDMFMDFVYVNDVIEAIDFFINNNTRHKDFNIVPRQKHTLKDIALKILEKMHLEEDRLKVLEPGLALPYTGNGDRIKDTLPNCNYNLDFGINIMIEYIH